MIITRQVSRVKIVQKEMHNISYSHLLSLKPLLKMQSEWLLSVYHAWTHHGSTRVNSHHPTHLLHHRVKSRCRMALYGTRAWAWTGTRIGTRIGTRAGPIASLHAHGRWTRITCSIQDLRIHTHGRIRRWAWESICRSCWLLCALALWEEKIEDCITFKMHPKKDSVLTKQYQMSCGTFQK